MRRHDHVNHLATDDLSFRNRNELIGHANSARSGLYESGRPADDMGRPKPPIAWMVKLLARSARTHTTITSIHVASISSSTRLMRTHHRNVIRDSYLRVPTGVSVRGRAAHRPSVPKRRQPDRRTARGDRYRVVAHGEGTDGTHIR